MSNNNTVKKKPQIFNMLEFQRSITQELYIRQSKKYYRG